MRCGKSYGKSRWVGQTAVSKVKNEHARNNNYLYHFCKITAFTWQEMSITVYKIIYKKSKRENGILRNGISLSLMILNHTVFTHCNKFSIFSGMYAILTPLISYLAPPECVCECCSRDVPRLQQWEESRRPELQKHYAGQHHSHMGPRC